MAISILVVGAFYTDTPIYFSVNCYCEEFSSSKGSYEVSISNKFVLFVGLICSKIFYLAMTDDFFLRYLFPFSFMLNRFLLFFVPRYFNVHKSIISFSLQYYTQSFHVPVITLKNRVLFINPHVNSLSVNLVL